MSFNLTFSVFSSSPATQKLTSSSLLIFSSQISSCDYFVRQFPCAQFGLMPPKATEDPESADVNVCQDACMNVCACVSPTPNQASSHALLFLCKNLHRERTFAAESRLDVSVISVFVCLCGGQHVHYLYHSESPSGIGFILLRFWETHSFSVLFIIM